MKAFYKQLIRRLVTPAAAVPPGENYQRAQFIAALSLMFTLAQVVIAIFVSTQYGFGDVDRLLWVMVMITFATYGLARTRCYERGALLLTAIILIETLAVIAIRPLAQVTPIVIMPFLISSFLWPPRNIALVAAISIGGMLLIMLPHGGDMRDVWLTALLALTVAVMIWGSALLRTQTRQHLDRMTTELRTSEARLQAAIQSMPFDFWSMDADGKYQMGNTHAANSYGDTIGRRLSEINVPESVRARWQVSNARAFKGEVVREEIEFEQNGQIYTYYNVVAPIRDGEMIVGICGFNMDVSETRQMQMVLRQHQARMAAIFESVPFDFWMMDPDGRYILQSAQSREMYGNVVGLRNEDITSVPADVRAEWQANNARALAGEVIQKYLVYTHTGDTRFTHNIVVPIHDGDEIIGISGINVDVTEVRQMEIALNEREAQYRSLIENSNDLIYTVFADRFELVNRRFTEMTGVSQEEIYAGHFTPMDLTSPKSYALMAEREAQRARGETPSRQYELVAQDRVGNEFDIEVSLADVPYKGGIAIQGIARDITERKQTERLLRENEARLQAMLQAIPDFIARIHRDGRYLAAMHGPDFEAIRTREDIIGRHIMDILPPELATQRLHYVDQALATGKLQSYEYADLMPDNQWHHFEARISVIDPDEVLLMVRDITARKEAEAHVLELTLQRQQADLLRAFVGDRTHDLMTPLTIIRTSLYLMGRANTPERRTDHATKLETQVDNLENMIRNMLMILRLDKPIEDEFDFKMGDIHNLIDKVVTDQQPVAISKGQILQYTGPSNLPLLAFDAEKMERALANLVDNALKYTGSGGTVLVDSSVNNGALAIVVQDNGPGIDGDELPLIFDRFYRAGADRLSTGGSGLGLAIVAKIVQAHGGDIQVESTPGTGTAFHMSLPLNSRPQQSS